MESRSVSNNVTLAGLRRLREALKKIVGEKEAVLVDLVLWHHIGPLRESSHIEERIGVYHSEGGPTKYFLTLREACKYLEKIKKGEA